MVKAIPMEDWLRGCVYHDGRHGEVTLPCDKVHQIANYIQRTRRSVSDGLIDLKVEPIADTPQTDIPSRDELGDCNSCEHLGDLRCGMCTNGSGYKRRADTPQTDKDKVVCPNCGRSDYIRNFENDFGIKNSEYRYKCINCNTYIKDTPQTERSK